jgi:hypothetical protein
MATNEKVPKVEIQKKPGSATAPLEVKELTLEEARAADKASAGGYAETRPKIKAVPRKDYTQKPTPPPDLGIAGAKEPTFMKVNFNNHGQVKDVEFSGKAALLVTSGRMRSFVGTLIKAGEIERRRLTHRRMIANEEAKALESKKSKKK